MIKDQEQSAEQGSTALQAGRDIIVTTGMSYSDVKEVALDVFRENFYKLAGIAKDTAAARAEEITEEFLKKLEAENPHGFQHANEPGFQYALLTVQKEHARTGDKDLGELLVDLLVDRTKQQQRNLLQIVLDESLATAPKLTESQLATLAVAFLFKYTQHQGIGNHDLLGQYLDKNVAPFCQSIATSNASYQHLEFTGCGTVGLPGINARSLESILGQTFQGLFLKGLDPKQIEDNGISLDVYKKLFVPCLNDPSKLQVRALNHDVLAKVLAQEQINTDDGAKIKALFDSSKMSDAEVVEKCVELRPYMASVFDKWANSSMMTFTLTSVGIAIGHANLKRLVGEFSDLSIWIN